MVKTWGGEKLIEKSWISLVDHFDFTHGNDLNDFYRPKMLRFIRIAMELHVKSTDRLSTLISYEIYESFHQ